MKVIDDKEYLTIKEFAAAANVSQQAIYKKLKSLNSFKSRSTKFKNQIYIEKSALSDFFDLNDSTAGCSTFNNFQQPNSTQEQDNVSALIEMLQKELEAKDKQIESLNNSLSDALKALDQQQKLAAVDKQKILELETSKQELEEAATSKKGFFSFWKK